MRPRSSPRPSALFFVLALALVATTSAARAGEPTTAREARPRSRYTEPGLFGPVRVGAVAAVGFPDGLQVGVLVKAWGWVAVGANAGWLPETKLPVVAQDARVVRVSGEVFTRVHPFRAGLFVGLGLGASQTKGTVTSEQTAFDRTVDARAHVAVQNVYVTPQVGYQWMFGSNVSATIRVGLEVPIRSSEPSLDVTTTAGAPSRDATGKLADAIRTASRTPLPVVNLLELGVLL